LVETEGKYGRYVSLSHSWGKAQIITTTKENIESHRKCIPTGGLSKNFSEAIDMTRRQGIPHIWIDSLFIVRNDKNDWAKEALKMGTFYQNPVLAIAAAFSSSEGGLYTNFRFPRFRHHR
ncbi:uncharacterized protein BDR25DRAFT_240051, partial [Lindgomyces ingoldianus]